MSHEQCWGLNPGHMRCEQPAAPGLFFCGRHWGLRGPHPVDIYSLPEAEMPPDLVGHIRARFPGFAFPAPQPVGGAADTAALERDPTTVASRLADSSASPPGLDPHDTPPAPPLPVESINGLDRLLVTIQEAMDRVMGDPAAAPLQQASAVARLAGLYLRGHRIRELEQKKRELAEQVALLERQLASANAEIAHMEAVASAWVEQMEAAGDPGAEGKVDRNAREEPLALTPPAVGQRPGVIEALSNAMAVLAAETTGRAPSAPSRPP